MHSLMKHGMNHVMCRVHVYDLRQGVILLHCAGTTMYMHLDDMIDQENGKWLGIIDSAFYYLHPTYLQISQVFWQASQGHNSILGGVRAYLVYIASHGSILWIQTTQSTDERTEESTCRSQK